MKIIFALVIIFVSYSVVIGIKGITNDFECGRGDCGDEREIEREELPKPDFIAMKIKDDVRTFLTALSNILKQTQYKGDEVMIETMMYYFSHSSSFHRITSRMKQAYFLLPEQQKDKLIRTLLHFIEQGSPDIQPTLKDLRVVLKESDLSSVLTDIWQQTNKHFKGDFATGVQELALPLFKILSDAGISINDPEIQTLLHDIIQMITIQKQFNPGAMVQVFLEQNKLGPKLNKLVTKLMSKVSLDPKVAKNFIEKENLKLDIRETYADKPRGRVPVESPLNPKVNKTKPTLPNRSTDTATRVDNLIDVAAEFIGSLGKNEDLISTIGTLIGENTGGGLSPQMLMGFLQLAGGLGNSKNYDVSNILSMASLLLDSSKQGGGNDDLLTSIMSVIMAIQGQVPQQWKNGDNTGGFSFTTLWTAAEEYLGFTFDPTMITNLIKLLPELIRSKDIIGLVRVLEGYGDFKINELVLRLENPEIREQITKELYPYIKDWIRPLISEKSREKFVRKGFNSISNFFVSRGHKPLKPNNQIDSLVETTTDYLKKSWGITNIPTKTYILLCIEYYKSVLESENGKTFLNLGDLTDDELQLKLDNIINEEIIVPAVNSWKALHITQKYPNCVDYVLCTLNDKTLLGKATELKKTVARQTSALIVWQLHIEGKVEISSILGIQAGLQGQDCKVLFSSKCSVVLGEKEDILNVDFFHNEL